MDNEYKDRLEQFWKDGWNNPKAMGETSTSIRLSSHPVRQKQFQHV